jgi:hypothetical protein
MKMVTTRALGLKEDCMLDIGIEYAFTIPGKDNYHDQSVVEITIISVDTAIRKCQNIHVGTKFERRG